MSNISGSNILITGAGSGIGRLLALRLAELGGNLILWDINKKGIGDVAEEIERNTGRKAHAYLCDVSKRKRIYAVADKVKTEVGSVDILVNNAGIVSGKSFLEIPDEKIELTFGVNTMALFWTAKSFLPDMIARNSGHIVTVASAAGVIGAAKLTDYCASKSAAIGFDESLRVELADTAPGVHTTMVAPFYIDTGMFEGVKTRFPALLPILKPDYVVQQMVKAIQNNTQRVIMPPMVYLSPVLRLLPTAMFDGIASLLGVNASMDSFIGREGGH